MDASRSQRSEPPQSTGGSRTDKDGKMPAVHRATRYKEKFQALREKYDLVVAIREDYQRDLEAASLRVKKLQAENDLLLDAIGIAAPSQPGLMQFIAPPPQSLLPVPLSHSQQPPHLSPTSSVVYQDLRSAEYADASLERPIQNGSRYPSNNLHMNGHSNNNGRHITEPSDSALRELEINGRIL